MPGGGRPVDHPRDPVGVQCHWIAAEPVRNLGREAGVGAVWAAVAEGAAFGFGEWGVDAARLDHAYPDAERAQLMAQRLAHRFQGVLAHRVRPHPRDRDLASDRADVDDPAVPAPAHARRHQLGGPKRPQHIDLELAANLTEREFFQRPALRYPGGIDQDVDVLGGHGEQVRLAGDIQPQRPAAHRRKRLAGRGVAIAGDDSRPLHPEPPGGRAADATARTSDQYCPCHGFLHHPGPHGLTLNFGARSKVKE
jgi:hypothetical protein